jgi:hypothetical protein
LQADGYNGFDGLYAGGHIAEAACWAHVRRHFYDIHVGPRQSPIAREALERIGQLYAVEAGIAGKQSCQRTAPLDHQQQRPSGRSLILVIGNAASTPDAY